jgi:hypothetical protein
VAPQVQQAATEQPVVGVLAALRFKLTAVAAEAEYYLELVVEVVLDLRLLHEEALAVALEVVVAVVPLQRQLLLKELLAAQEDQQITMERQLVAL